MEMNLEKLRLADFNFTACGRPRLPDGARFIDIPKTLVYTNVLNPGDSLPDERQSIEADTVFILKAIQSRNSAFVTVRFQWPDGSYLSNVPMRINTAYGQGANRRVFRNGRIIRPGEQIRFSLLYDTTGAAGLTASRVVFLFEGFYRYYLKDRTSPACCIEQL